MREIHGVIDEIFENCPVADSELRECLAHEIEQALVRDRKRLNEKFQMAIGGFRSEIETALLPKKEGND